MSRDIERLRKRLNRLKRLQEWHEHVCSHRRQLFFAGWRPREIVLRADFILSGAAGRSPIVRLITPHGIALQTYLVALFEAQCRHRNGTTPLNDRPLRAQEPGEVGWLDLLASVATADPVNSVEHATVQDNRLRQIKSALRVLSTACLVSVAGQARSNGRFEGFVVGHESGIGNPVAYTVPRRGGPAELIRLPVDFFLKGWVHALSPAEIATYLMLRHLAARFPSQHKENGVFVAGSTRETLYGLRRDVYEAHQLLTSFRLVERLPDPKRWPSGHIRDYHKVQERGEIVQPHRFRLLDDCFRRDALRVVRGRVEWNLPDISQ